MVCTDALRFLARVRNSFDLVLVDPPYASGLARIALERLLALQLLCAGGRVYLEHDGAAGAAFRIPPPLRLYRELRAGTVCGRLLLG